MRIIVVHGDNNLESYNRLQALIEIAKTKNFEILRSDPSRPISEQLVSESLFNQQRLIVVEDYKLIDKRTIEWIKKNDQIPVSLLIFHQSTIPKNFIESLPKIDKIEEFQPPKIIFNFLESFYPGNSSNVLKLLHRIVEKDPIELIFFLLTRHIRDLYWIKVDPTGTGYPYWKVEKLKKQASLFTTQNLIELISYLCEIDIRSKTSLENLLDLLDLLIVSKLE